MHITNLYVMASMATLGHPEGFEATVRDLHAIAKGYESWDHYHAFGSQPVDPSILDTNHANFEITIKCVGEIQGQIRYHLWYEAPDIGAMSSATKRITIYTDLNGLVANVELDNV